jgi:hypothetical protein
MSEHYDHAAAFYDDKGRWHCHVRHVDIDDDHHRVLRSDTDDCPTCHPPDNVTFLRPRAVRP